MYLLPGTPPNIVVYGGAQYGNFEVDVSVCGYHHYKEAGNAVVGEELQCVQEPGNTSDPYSVAVEMGGRDYFLSYH